MNRVRFYQFKNNIKIYKVIFIFNSLLMGALAICALFDVGVKSNSSFERIFAFIFFMLMFLIPIGASFYMKKYKMSECLIEFSEQGITYRVKNNIITLQWEDVEEISIFNELYLLPTQRILRFYSKDTLPLWDKLWSYEKSLIAEYNDEMLDEIKKYWYKDIINEEKYIKYKKKRDRRSTKRK